MENQRLQTQNKDLKIKTKSKNPLRATVLAYFLPPSLPSFLLPDNFRKKTGILLYFLTAHSHFPIVLCFLPLQISHACSQGHSVLLVDPSNGFNPQSPFCSTDMIDPSSVCTFSSVCVYHSFLFFSSKFSSNSPTSCLPPNSENPSGQSLAFSLFVFLSYFSNFTPFLIFNHYIFLTLKSLIVHCS